MSKLEARPTFRVPISMSPLRPRAIYLAPNRTGNGTVQQAANRAVLYLPVSSSRQVKTDYDPEGGISIPAQHVTCERKASQLDLEIIDEYVEPGRSGTEMTKRTAS